MIKQVYEYNSWQLQNVLFFSCSKAGKMKHKELDRPCNAEPHVTHQDKEAHVILLKAIWKNCFQ